MKDRFERWAISVSLLMIVVASVLMASTARAAPVTIQYELPTQDCDNQPVGEILELEIYVSAGPIPASDVSCPPAGEAVDAPPETFSTLITDASGGATVVDLVGGQTYYARARVRTASGWSNLSNEKSFEVPARPGKAPILIRIGF